MSVDVIVSAMNHMLFWLSVGLVVGARGSEGGHQLSQLSCVATICVGFAGSLLACYREEKRKRDSENVR